MSITEDDDNNTLLIGILVVFFLAAYWYMFMREEAVAAGPVAAGPVAAGPVAAGPVAPAAPVTCTLGQKLEGGACVPIECGPGMALVGNNCISQTGVWRKGAIGDFSKRKGNELFTYKCRTKKGRDCLYPQDLWVCADQAKARDRGYIHGRAHGSNIACTFYNDDGVDAATVNDGDVVDIENTSYTGALHYVVPK